MTNEPSILMALLYDTGKVVQGHFQQGHGIALRNSAVTFLDILIQQMCCNRKQQTCLIQGI